VIIFEDASAARNLKIHRGIESLMKKMHQKALTVVCGIVEKLLKVVTQFASSPK
jgi:hypothetical protein